MASTVTDHKFQEEYIAKYRNKERHLGFSVNLADALGHKVFNSIHDTNKPYINAQGYPSTYRPLGNLLFRPYLDMANVHYGSLWNTMQLSAWPRHCRIMERDYFRCLARVGVQNSTRWCQNYWEDVLECSHHLKSRKRYMTMKKIRKEKGIAPMKDAPVGVHDFPF